MRLRRIRLTQIGPHEEIDWELRPGVIGILGPNGCGKSTAVNAAYAALTNDYSRFEGGKQGVLRQLAGEKDKSVIEIEVEHEGHTYSLGRGIRPDKHWFECLGSSEKPLAKAGEIATAIEETLGVSRPILDNYVFVSQWDMFAFLSLTDTERAKHFAKLCRTEVAETLWTMLGRSADLDRGLITEIVDNSDEIRQEMARRENRKEALQRKRERAVERRLTQPSEVERLRAMAVKRERYLGALRELPQAQQEEEELLEAAKAATKAVKEGEQVLQKAHEALRHAQDAVDNQAEEVSALRKQLRQADEARELEEELLEVQEEAQEAPEWPEELGDQDPTAIQEDAQAAAAAFVDAQELAALASSDYAECPTCKTPTTAGKLRDRIRKATKELPVLEAEHKRTQQQVVRLAQYEHALQEYKVWKSGHDATVKRIQAARDKLPAVDEEQVNARLGELARVTEHRDLCRGRVDGATEALPGLRKAKARAIAAHVQRKQRRKQLEESARTDKVTKQEVKRAKVLLANHEKAGTHLAAIRARIEEIDRNQEEDKQRLRQLKAAQKQSKSARKWVAFLDEARAVMHRERLPAEVHRAVLHEMEYDINTSLRDFGADFVVETNESLGFTAFFDDGVVMPSGGLSGGEKVTLALPFRLQVNSMFAAQVGMLVLDEPTAGLDEEHIDSVVEVFDTLRGQAKAEGFQVIVITHERELQRAFDQVFELGT